MGVLKMACSHLIATVTALSYLSGHGVAVGAAAPVRKTSAVYNAAISLPLPMANHPLTSYSSLDE